MILNYYKVIWGQSVENCLCEEAALVFSCKIQTDCIMLLDVTLSWTAICSGGQSKKNKKQKKHHVLYFHVLK